MLNNYIKTYINQMARRTNTQITEKHRDVLKFAYNYYEKNSVGPLYKNIERYTGVSKKELESLFPYGLNSVYTWVGIPIQSVNDSCKPIATVHVENKREIYFDHNGTTYIRPEVKKLLEGYYRGDVGYGNPSSSTHIGRRAFNQIKDARKIIADCIKVKPGEILFTGCGSESNNYAVKGIGLKYMQTKSKGHIITSQIEHPSVLESIQFFGMFGFDITFLDTNSEGLISAQDVQNALRCDTLLVSIMAVNNEIGTVNPISEIGEICRLAEVPFMVDAIQAFGKIELKPKEMGISLMSFSGHKLYAPKGIAGLYVDESISLVPLIHGGEQEFHKRAGTENVGHIMALGLAVKLAHKEMDTEMNRIAELRDYFLNNLKHYTPGYIINGSLKKRLPTNLNIGFPNVDSGALLLSLNKIGIYVSAGSACSAGSKEASSVIKSLGVDTDTYGSIRFSFGLESKKEDIDYLFQYLPDILDQIKAE